jgi:hypothetical protein
MVIVVFPYPLYSLDLMLCDFSIFPWVKDWLKGCHFKDTAKVEVTLKIALVQGFQKCYRLL